MDNIFNKSQLAQKLDISRNTLYKILDELDLRDKKKYSNEDFNFISKYMKSNNKNKQSNNELLSLQQQNQYLQQQNVHFINQIEQKELENKELRQELNELKDKELKRLETENKNLKINDLNHKNSTKKWWNFWSKK